MPARKVVSPAQMEHMLQYMENNRNFAIGRLTATGPLGKQALRQKWDALAAELNAFGNGATKTAMKWRDYWCEKKYAVRKKAQEKSLHARGTGGGPPKNITLNPVEERMLALMGNVAVEGNVEARIPFELQSDNFEEETSAVYLAIPPSPLIPQGPSPAPPAISPIAGPSSAPPSFFSTPNSSIHLTQCSDSPTPERSRVTTNARIEPPAPRWALEFEERNAAAQERQAAALEEIPRMLAENRAAVEQLTATAASITAAIVAMTNELAAIRECVNKMSDF